MEGLKFKKTIRNKIPLAFFYLTIVTMALLVSIRFNKLKI